MMTKTGLAAQEEKKNKIFYSILAYNGDCYWVKIWWKLVKWPEHVDFFTIEIIIEIVNVLNIEAHTKKCLACHTSNVKVWGKIAIFTELNFWGIKNDPKVVWSWGIWCGLWIWEHVCWEHSRKMILTQPSQTANL